MLTGILKILVYLYKVNYIGLLIQHNDITFTHAVLMLTLLLFQQHLLPPPRHFKDVPEFQKLNISIIFLRKTKELRTPTT